MKTAARDILGEILTSGVDVHRCAAARALGEIAAPGASGLLRKALLDEDPDVRTDAAEALARLADPDCAEALMENLVGDPEPDVKKAALRGLVKMRHAPVIGLLRKLAVSRTEEIVWDEDEFYTEGWDSWVDLQLLAIQGLAELGAVEGVPDILKAMADEFGQDLTEPGTRALARLGAPGAEALGILLESDAVRLRRRVADAVAACDNPHAAPLIERMLKDTAPAVRQIAALGLDPADPRLEPMFDDPDAKVRASIVHHAGASFPQKVAGLVDDPEPAVRIQVFRIIAARPELFGGEEEELADALKRAIAGEAKAASAAAIALVALKGEEGIRGMPSALLNAEKPLEFRLGLIEALKRAGPVAVPHLLCAAGDDNRRIRLNALTAVVDFAANDPIWPNAAGEGLLAALNGELVVPPDEPQQEGAPREATAEAEETPDKGEAEAEEVPDLAAPVADVQDSTLDSIISGGGTETTEEAPEPEAFELDEQAQRLIRLAEQRKMAKRKVSLEVEVAPHLDVRRFAATLLGEVVNPDVTEALLAVLDDDDAELREAALSSLVQHGERTGRLPDHAAGPLLALATAGDEGDGGTELRVLALRALGRVEGEEAEAVLRQHLADPDPLLRVEAVRALGNRGIADRQVEQCLEDDYPGVCLEAATSLIRNRGEEAAGPLAAFAFRHNGTYRHEIGRMLGAHAPRGGTEAMLAVLQDEEMRRSWLVAIDALAEIFRHENDQEELKIA